MNTEISPAGMKKLRVPRNLTDLAYNSIREHIVRGRLDESSRLTEDFLCRQLGISKSPIREALNRLESEGLIRIEPRRGAFLRTFSIKEIDDMYDLRDVLERHAVRTARVTPKLLQELGRIVKRMREYLEANEKARYIDEDVGFHKLLASATGNEKLRMVLENLQSQIWLSRRKTYDLSSSTACDFHEAIIGALEAEDRDRAEQLMGKHIQTVRTKLLEFLAAQETDATRGNTAQ